MNTTRRDFTLGTLAAAAGTTLAAAEADAARRVPLDTSQVHRLWRRMRYAGHDRPFFWWLRGRRYGVVDNVMTPFFDMQVGSFHRVEDLGDDGYRVFTASVVYYTDIATNELLTTWRNPVTGRDVEFRYAPPTASVSEYDYATGPRPDAPRPGLTVQRRQLYGPVDVVGDDVWIREEEYIVLQRESQPQPQRVHDMYVVQSPLRALTDAAVKFVPATGYFNDLNSWSPRFEMGGLPGSGFARCFGRKESRLEALPDVYLRLGRRLHPDAFRDPGAVLARAG